MFRRPLTTAALALALAAPARADITPEQLWSQAQAAVAEAGATLAAQERRTGDRLMLIGGNVTLADGTLLLLPDVLLSPTPDGGVSLGLPARFPVAVELPGFRYDPERLLFTVSAPDLSLVVRALGEDADIDLAARSLTVTLDSVRMPPDSPVAPADLFLALAVADVALTHRHALVPSTDMTIASRLDLGALHAEMRLDVPDERIKVALSLDLAGITALLDGRFPAAAREVLDSIADKSEPDLATMIAALDRGLSLKAEILQESASLSLDTPLEQAGPNALSLSLTRGAERFSLDRAAITYDAGVGPTRLFYRGTDPDIPLPEFAAAVGEFRAAARLGLPGGAETGSPTGGDWGLLYRLAGLTVSPEIWDRVDPQRVIPRDPVFFVADMAGSYRLDPAALAPGWKPVPGAPPPVTALTVKLAELLLSGAGASLNGHGDVALDLTTMTTPDAIPRADGRLSFVTQGANALLDRLARLGAITPDELTGARFGLLFLGRIEGGADRLVTELEFDDRSVVLNGQKIR